MQPTKINAFLCGSGFETLKIGKQKLPDGFDLKISCFRLLKGGWAGAARGAGAAAGAHARARQGEGDRPRDCLRQGEHHRQVPLFRQSGLPHFGLLLSEGISFFYKFRIPHTGPGFLWIESNDFHFPSFMRSRRPCGEPIQLIFHFFFCGQVWLSLVGYHSQCFFKV